MNKMKNSIWGKCCLCGKGMRLNARAIKISTYLQK